MIRSDPRFNSKENQGLIPSSQRANTWILLLQPFLDLFRPLLICSPNRTLRRQTQLIQQTAHRGLAQFYAKSLIDDFSDYLGCPKSKGELQLQKIFHGHRVAAKYAALDKDYPISNGNILEYCVFLKATEYCLVLNMTLPLTKG